MASSRKQRKSSAPAELDAALLDATGRASPTAEPLRPASGNDSAGDTESGAAAESESGASAVHDAESPQRFAPVPLAPDEAIDWFAAAFEPLASIAIGRGVRLPVLIDALKLALVRAAASEPGGTGSDSRVAVMTGVHRRDLRRIRQTGATARTRSSSLAGEVFARWQSDPRFLTRRGEPRVLPRQDDGSGKASFVTLVASISRDVHPRPVLDELIRLGMVSLHAGSATRADKSGGRVRLIQTAFVPAVDQAEMLAYGRDNLADHGRAVAANLAGGGRQFLDQALYSDGLSAASATQFNRETLAAWKLVFDKMMPRLRELYEADRESAYPRDHRVRLGMYGLAVIDTEAAGLHESSASGDSSEPLQKPAMDPDRPTTPKRAD